MPAIVVAPMPACSAEPTCEDLHTCIVQLDAGEEALDDAGNRLDSASSEVDASDASALDEEAGNETAAVRDAGCDGDECTALCGPSFKACGSACIQVNACCTTMECPANSTCSGNTCQCNLGFKLCDGACIPASSCCRGNECQANATCSSAKCTCNTTFKDCNGVCVPEGGCCTSGECSNGFACSGNTCQCQLPSIVCQGRCLNGASDTNNCGACGHVCPLGCAQSQCKCAAAGINALPNPGFDTGTSSWQFSNNGGTSTSAWTNNDAVGCPASGSIRLRTMVTTTFTASFTPQGLCVALPPSPVLGTYSAGLRARRVSAASGELTFDLRYFADASCVGGPLGNVTTTPAAIGTEWMPVSAGPSPSGAAGVMFIVYATKTDQAAGPFEVDVDMVYVAPSPGTGWL